MLVRSAMSSPVEVVDAGSSCAAVWAWFQERRLRRAPVVDGTHILGIVTDRDLLPLVPQTVDELEQGEEHRSYKTPVASILKRELLSVGPNDHLEVAAQLMLRKKLSCLAVVDSSGPVPALAGIVTDSDLFRLFVRRTQQQRGHRVVLRAPTHGRAPVDPAAVCVKAGALLFDLSCSPLETGGTTVVLQVQTDKLTRLIDRFLALGYECVLVEES